MVVPAGLKTRLYVLTQADLTTRLYALTFDVALAGRRARNWRRSAGNLRPSVLTSGSPGSLPLKAAKWVLTRSGTNNGR